MLPTKELFFRNPQTPPVSICFPTSSVNTPLLEGPSFTPLPVHHVTLHILPFIILKIHFLEINRRHVYTVRNKTIMNWKSICKWQRILPPYLEQLCYCGGPGGDQIQSVWLFANQNLVTKMCCCFFLLWFYLHHYLIYTICTFSLE